MYSIFISLFLFIIKSGNTLKDCDLSTLVTRDSSFYDQNQRKIRLGRFNTEKFECFKDVVGIAYSDDDVEEKTYAVDFNNRQFVVDVKDIAKKCNPMKVKTLVWNISGRKVHEKLFVLKDSQLQGVIKHMEYKQGDKIFMKFHSN